MGYVLFIKKSFTDVGKYAVHSAKKGLTLSEGTTRYFTDKEKAKKYASNKAKAYGVKVKPFGPKRRKK